MALKIRRDDTVQVIAGKDAGKTGKRAARRPRKQNGLRRGR